MKVKKEGNIMLEEQRHRNLQRQQTVAQNPGQTFEKCSKLHKS